MPENVRPYQANDISLSIISNTPTQDTPDDYWSVRNRFESNATTAHATHAETTVSLR